MTTARMVVLQPATVTILTWLKGRTDNQYCLAVPRGKESARSAPKLLYVEPRSPVFVIASLICELGTRASQGLKLQWLSRGQVE
jgi:hypothetical protein